MGRRRADTGEDNQRAGLIPFTDGGQDEPDDEDEHKIPIEMRMKRYLGDGEECLLTSEGDTREDEKEAHGKSLNMSSKGSTDQPRLRVNRALERRPSVKRRKLKRLLRRLVTEPNV